MELEFTGEYPVMQIGQAVSNLRAATYFAPQDVTTADIKKGDISNAPTRQAAFDLALAQLEGRPAPIVPAWFSPVSPFESNLMGTGTALRGAVDTGWSRSRQMLGSFARFGWNGVTALGGLLWRGARAIARMTAVLFASTGRTLAGLLAPGPVQDPPGHIPGLPLGHVPGTAWPKPAPAPRPAHAHRSLPGPKAKPPAAKAPAANRLRGLSAADLAALGRTDHAGFLAALRPAAEETQRLYGVPAAITLAQAALETGWGRHLAANYNLFGIKGTGSAGSARVKTREVVNGKDVMIYANFASYHNFYEAVEAHGKLFHNGYYTRALANYGRTHSIDGFAKDITGTYATDPSYGSKLISIMRTYHLE
jgi:hypothetical protein